MRLIPAWAGKTSGASQPGGTNAAHPRVGGENRIINAIIDHAAGSSPRGRGKPYLWASRNADLRLIPAWAGKTLAV